MENLSKIGFSNGLAIIRKLVYNLPISYQAPFLEVLDELDKSSITLKNVLPCLDDAISDAKLEILDLDFQLHATQNELDNERKKNQ